MRYWRLLVLVLAFAAGAALGGPMEDAEAAYKKNDYAAVLRLIRPLAESGNASGQTNLGFMYENGQGVPKDDQQAVYWYRKAADQGYALAQTKLAALAAHAKDDAPSNRRDALGEAKRTLDRARAAHSKNDYRTAVRLYLPLAQGGDATAQFNLGVMYDEGQGVPRDDQLAWHWYRKAADQGCAEAEFNIGVMYASGQGVPKDFKQAADWYRKAAVQGFVEAQRALANLYLSGQGVPKSETQSKYWNQLAANQAADNVRAEQEKKRLADQAAENNRLLAAQDADNKRLVAEAARAAKEEKKRLADQAVENKRLAVEAARTARDAERGGAVEGQDPLRQAKRTCADIGFKPATEKFGECVLQMIKGSGDPGSIGVQTAAANQGNVLAKARLADVTVPTPSYAPQPPQSNSLTSQTSSSTAARAGKYMITNEGCELWNPSPEDGDSVSWSGACANGLAQGKGVEKWFKNGNLGNTVLGSMINGVLVGEAKVTYNNGDEYIGLLGEDGSRDGIGTLRKSSGTVLNGRWTRGDFITPWDGNKRPALSAAPVEPSPQFLSPSRAGQLIITHEGCKLFDASPEDGKTVSWSGDCVDGLVQGKGREAWYKNGKLWRSSTGTADNGRVMHMDLPELAQEVNIKNPTTRASSSNDFDWGDLLQRLGNASEAYQQQMQKDRGQTITMPNGLMMTCKTTGTMTNCF